MKHLIIVFGSLAIVCLLAAFSILFDVGLLPWEDKWFFTLLFLGMMLIGITLFFDAKSEIAWTEDRRSKRKQAIKGTVIITLASFCLVLLAVFGLP